MVSLSALRNSLRGAALLVALAALVPAQAGTIVDVVGAGTGYFAPAGQENVSPYYRYADGDWGWSQGPVSASNIVSAKLTIGSWDADYSQGEIDNLYIWHGGGWELLGPVMGTDGDLDYAAGFSSNTFTLGSQYFGDLAAGLKLWFDIDATEPVGMVYWAVALTDSTLTVQTGNTVPEGGSTLMLVGVSLLGLLIFLRRRR